MVTTTIRHTLFIMFFAVLSSPAFAVPITSILNLDIDGTHYDVTFHGVESFDAVFDTDRDNVFGESDHSAVNHAPTFWGDRDKAILAADAIITYLGASLLTSNARLGSFGTDGFIVPWATGIRAGGVDFFGRIDGDDDLIPDINAGFTRFKDYYTLTQPIASFELASPTAPVPTPSTLLLAGVGVALMGFISRRKRVS
jgi:hypothetical protein